jgi:hypothetical protein
VLQEFIYIFVPFSFCQRNTHNNQPDLLFAQKMSTKRRRQQDTKTNTTAHQATTTAVQMVLSLPRLIACILQYYTDNIVVLCKLHSVNKLFRSVLTSPVHAAGMIRVINLLHLENIESLDETQVLWALQTCHMSLVEIRIQNQNITKLLETSAFTLLSQTRACLLGEL